MNSNEIIAKRDNLSKEITNYWTIIKSTNVVDKSYQRKYDLKGILTFIEKLAKERITMKLYSQCINMGYKKASEMPSNSIFPVIFELSEINEQYVQLGLIPTLDPNLKSKKGKKNLDKKEELTTQYIKKLRDSLMLKIIELKKKLSDYNNEAELDTTSPLMYLAA